ncbi:MAG: cobalt-precorrin-5B (C(1))-methyltransferase [Actinobacteria bacterium]|nr:cobalt-precorrin-5B (C(1))-methyltransferase [Actinomycetota bacterium]MCL5446183.1 cobalt-precorrin-5B (C(1))-methyltransferase [Actinomycetota bacterium]
MPDIMVQRPRTLRKGYTTGTCAAAAAKAALTGLIAGKVPQQIDVMLPRGDRVVLPVDDAGPVDHAGPMDHASPSQNPVQATAVVVKDAGDDPDCTDGARMTATVLWAPDSVPTTLLAGPGIGTVTLEGLGIPVGEPAITSIPRKMILESLAEVSTRPVMVRFSVPGGETMARETTNARLGIIGGISILGTTGIVKPFSTAAYRASIMRQIDVATARNYRDIILCIGSRSERAAMAILPNRNPVVFVEVGDFTGAALKHARRRRVSSVTLVAMAGKITKLASGIMMTHFHKSNVDTQLLSEIAVAAGAPLDVAAAATQTATARHFYDACLQSGHTAPLIQLCELAREQCMAFVDSSFSMQVFMVDFDSGEVVASAGGE